jgi:hypothetical protein
MSKVVATKINIETEQDAIQEWKRLGITSCSMPFSCGGDNMNEYSFEFNKAEDGKLTTIESSELHNFFEDEVFRKVMFYECSDGHYMGEAGTVEITLNEDDDKPFFDYSKSSESEWHESVTKFVKLDLTEEEKVFLKSKVRRIEGANDQETFYVYDGICLLNDDEIVIRENLSEKLSNIAYSYDEWDGFDWDSDDSYRWEVNVDGGDEIEINITRWFYMFKSE